MYCFSSAKNNMVLINLIILRGLGACSPRKIFLTAKTFLVASETVSDICWFPCLYDFAGFKIATY